MEYKDFRQQTKIMVVFISEIISAVFHCVESNPIGSYGELKSKFSATRAVFTKHANLK